MCWRFTPFVLFIYGVKQIMDFMVNFLAGEVHTFIFVQCLLLNCAIYNKYFNSVFKSHFSILWHLYVNITYFLNRSIKRERKRERFREREWLRERERNRERAGEREKEREKERERENACFKFSNLNFISSWFSELFQAKLKTVPLIIIMMGAFAKVLHF